MGCSKNLFIAVFISVLCGCSSTRLKDTRIDFAFRSGNYLEAEEALQEGLESEGEFGDDGLLYLLDLGLVQQLNGKIKESIKTFSKAYDVAKIQDYTSLTGVTVGLITSDNSKAYTGEDFEVALIPVFQALNYAILGQFEDALIEVRRLNRILSAYESAGKPSYKLNAFAVYLGALIYEAQGKWDDAYIDYKKTYELAPTLTELREDLVRLSLIRKRDQDVDFWKKRLHLTFDEIKQIREDLDSYHLKSRVFVVFQNGAAPLKRPDPLQPQSIPKFYAQFNPVTKASVKAFKLDSAGHYAFDSSGELEFKSASTRVLQSIERVALQNFNETVDGVIARKLGGAVVKEIVGASVGAVSKSQELGQILKWFLWATDEADCRSWQLLPKDFQIAKLSLSPGLYEVEVKPVGTQESYKQKIELKPNQSVFMNYRYIPGGNMMKTSAGF